MIKHNKDTDKLKSPDIRDIQISNTKIIYKNNKNRLQIPETIIIKNEKKKKPTKNNNTGMNVLNMFINLPYHPP